MWKTMVKIFYSEREANKWLEVNRDNVIIRHFNVSRSNYGIIIAMLCDVNVELTIKHQHKKEE